MERNKKKVEAARAEGCARMGAVERIGAVERMGAAEAMELKGTVERGEPEVDRQRVKRVSVRMTMGEYHAMAMLAERAGFGTIAAFLRSAAFVLLHDLRLAADGFVPSKLRDTEPDDIEGEVSAMFRDCEDGGWNEWPADINRRK